MGALGYRYPFCWIVEVMSEIQILTSANPNKPKTSSQRQTVPLMELSFLKVDSSDPRNIYDIKIL